MKTATITWRESVTDLATDLQALLTRAQLIDLCDALAVSAARASRAAVNPMHLLGDPASFDEAEADPPSLASARPVAIEHLIERSSLGTSEAKAMRAATPPEVVERVLQRADELDAMAEHGKRRSYKCAHPECPGYPWPASEVAHPCGGSAEPPEIISEDVIYTFSPAPDVEPETCGCEESLWLRARLDALSTQAEADAGLREERRAAEPDGDPPLSVSVPGAVVAWLDSLTKRYHEVQMGTAELRIRAYEFGTEDDGRVSFEVDVEQRTTEGFSGPVR